MDTSHISGRALICLVNITVGQMLLRGACPNTLATHPGLEDVSFMKNIDVTWYTYVRYYSPYYTDKCEEFTFHTRPNSSVMKLVYRAHTLQGARVRRVSYIQPLAYPNSDVWDTQVVPDVCYDERPFPTKLVDIIPGTQLTLWACDNVVASGTRDQWRHESMWLMSASRPTPDMRLALNMAHLINMGLDPSHFIFVNQTNCQ